MPLTTETTVIYLLSWQHDSPRSRPWYWGWWCGEKWLRNMESAIAYPSPQEADRQRRRLQPGCVRPIEIVACELEDCVR